jgi:hypothetical protein
MAKKTADDPSKFPPLGRKLLWLDDMGNIAFVVKLLAGFCGLLFIGDLVYHRHGHFSLEAIWGFYGIFGFLAFAFIVIAAKNLRRLIGRPETYYSPGVIDGEDYPDEELEVINHHDR